MLAVALAAPFLGLDNFAVAVALGSQGIPRRRRALVVALFGGMACLALVVGESLGSASAPWLGSSAHLLGGLILISIGANQLWQQRRARARAAAPIADSLVSLILLTISVSLDTMAAGVAFGLRGDRIVSSAIVVGTVTAALSVLGLQVGAQVGRWRELQSRFAPVMLVGIGIAIVSGTL